MSREAIAAISMAHRLPYRSTYVIIPNRQNTCLANPTSEIARNFDMFCLQTTLFLRRLVIHWQMVLLHNNWWGIDFLMVSETTLPLLEGEKLPFFGTPDGGPF